ncbi:MAG: hypothetical protein MZV65_18135 [Chromatiales bacterium]|nr:hypothetical protein [Chromatiales bacterium]
MPQPVIESAGSAARSDLAVDQQAQALLEGQLAWRSGILGLFVAGPRPCRA